MSLHKRNLTLLFLARALRTFTFGAVSIVLPLYLNDLGFSAAQIGMLLTATLIEDAAFTTYVSAIATRIGQRNVLILTPVLILIAGAILTFTSNWWLICIAITFGVVSPAGLEAGPFHAIESAVLPDCVERENLTHACAWYNIFGFLPSSFGALLTGLWMVAADHMHWAQTNAYRCVFAAYALSGLLMSAAYLGLRVATAKPPTDNGAPKAVSRFGLHKSFRIVMELAAIQGVDAVAGGFILQSLIAYWFHVRYGVGAEILGPIFFGTNLLSAASLLAAPWLAKRIGLLNTMVFTHLPSNILLALIPFMPTLPLAVVTLFARHALSQMDVPTRQAYMMLLVDPDERPAAFGITASVRSVAQALAPFLSGLTMARAASGLPFYISGGLKSAYDLVLYFRFRNVPLEDPAKKQQGA